MAIITDITSATARSPSNEGALALLCAVQIAAWTAIPALTYSAPPLDAVENYVWGPHWLLGSFKHPALPSWLLEISRLATGATGWPSYLIAQCAVCATFILTFLLGRAVIGPERALAATLLLPWMYFFQWRTSEFNHNIALMPLWAGIALAAWRAVETRKLTWWATLGIVAAAALYAKLSALMLLVVCGVWLLADSKARATLRTRGPWIALMLFAALAAPLAWWVFGADSSPLAYAARRATFRSLEIARATPLLLLIASAVLPPLLALEWGSRAREPIPATADQRRFLAFLVTLTLGPLLLTGAAAAAAGNGARLMWAAPMFSFVGLIAVTARRQPFAAVPLSRSAAATMALIVILATVNGAMVRLSPDFNGRLTRAAWPQAEIAERFLQTYRRQTGRPLTIVAGPMDNWLAGLIALDHLPSVKVFTAGEFSLAPWLSESDLAELGALIVWDDPGCGPSKDIAHLLGGVQPSILKFDRPGSAGAKTLAIGYAIYPPGAADGRGAAPLAPPPVSLLDLQGAATLN